MIERPRCSFCQQYLYVTSSCNGYEFAFRCYSCNVRVFITNPSSLSYELRTFCRKIIRERKVGRQDKVWETQ